MNFYQGLSALLALFIFILYIYFGLYTTILNENGKNTRYSFKKFQLWLWAMVITPLFVIHWGYCDKHIPCINQTSLILLGIVAGTFTTAQIIANIKEQAQLSGSNSKQIKELIIESNSNLKRSLLYDIIKDDDGNLSLGRLQCLAFNIIFVIIYISFFFGSPANLSMSTDCVCNWSCDCKMALTFPKFTPEVFILLGISNSGYLSAKTLNK